ncbi:MAG: hypothetical protein CFE24_12820 [Flavobacterium sp. BFFFF2]|nr:MAG: hypothetical protein CFE24_12820 [Flavobacterium sp. BFFFF2]
MCTWISNAHQGFILQAKACEPEAHWAISESLICLFAQAKACVRGFQTRIKVLFCKLKLAYLKPTGLFQKVSSVCLHKLKLVYVDFKRASRFYFAS